MLQHGGFRAGGVILMDAHQLGFRAESFDAALITGVLHDLNIDKVAAEVHRVLRGRRPAGLLRAPELRPGHVGDPPGLAASPRDEGVRSDGAEEGLQEKELEAFRRLFAQAHVQRFNFSAKANRLRRRFGPFAEGLRWPDDLLLSAVPVLRRYCTCIVARFEKECEMERDGDGLWRFEKESLTTLLLWSTAMAGLGLIRWRRRSHRYPPGAYLTVRSDSRKGVGVGFSLHPLFAGNTYG